MEREELPDTTTSGNVSMVGHVAAVASSLPGQFLALCLINLFFILGLFWFESNLAEQRTIVLSQLLKSCMGVHN